MRNGGAVDYLLNDFSLESKFLGPIWLNLSNPCPEAPFIISGTNSLIPRRYFATPSRKYPYVYCEDIPPVCGYIIRHHGRW